MSNILDGLTNGIWFFAFGLVALIALFIFNSLSASGIFGAYAASFNDFFVALNNMAVFIVLGMSIGAIASAYLIKSHPVFFGIAVILCVLNFLIIPPLVNAFNGVAASFPAEATTFSLLVFLLDRLPIITVAASLFAAFLGLAREGL